MAASAPSAPMALKESDHVSMTIAEVEEDIAKLKAIWREKVRPIAEKFGELFTENIGAGKIESIPTIPQAEGNSHLAPEKFGPRPLPMGVSEMGEHSILQGTLTNQCPFIVVLLKAINPTTGKTNYVFTEIVFKSSLQSDDFLTSRRIHSDGEYKDSHLRLDRFMSEAEMKAFGGILKGGVVSATSKDEDVLIMLAKKQI